MLNGISPVIVLVMLSCWTGTGFAAQQIDNPNASSFKLIGSMRTFSTPPQALKDITEQCQNVAEMAERVQNVTKTVFFTVYAPEVSGPVVFGACSFYQAKFP